MASGFPIAPVPLSRQTTIYIPSRSVYRFNPFGSEEFYDTISMVEFIAECEANREKWEIRNGTEMPRVDPTSVNPFEMERLLRYTGSNWLDSVFPDVWSVTTTPPPRSRRDTPPGAPRRLQRQVARELNFEYSRGDEILDFEPTSSSNDTLYGPEMTELLPVNLLNDVERSLSHPDAESILTSS